MILWMLRQQFLADNNSPRAARFLEDALLFNLFIHAVAMLSMAALLLPGMPGGPVQDIGARAGYVAAHPWAWRLGWLPWQMTACADFLLSLALALTPWIPRNPAIVTLLLTIAAIVSRVARRIAEFLPAPQLVSDIRDVIYINYLVDADRLRPLVPAGLDLQCLGPSHQSALFTVLIYRHGHFGPPGAGWFRGLLPSPIQSNWRVYVTDTQTGSSGVYFVTTAITNLWVALMARLFAEGVPMHLPESAELQADGNGTFHLSIAPGQGSAPDLRACLRPIDQPRLPRRWIECFFDYHQFLDYCVPQNRALAPQPWYRRMVCQEINVSAQLENCVALEGPVKSTLLRELVNDVDPLIFMLPAVGFHFQHESSERLG